ncbi:MAG: terminase TerL endonuclease subunit [bacterium]
MDGVPGTKDGLNISSATLDEAHAYKPDKGDKMLKVIKKGTLARSNSLLTIITTAGFDRNSLAKNLYDYSVKLLNGEIKDDSFFCQIFEIDPDDYLNWRDKNIWCKANPNLNITIPIENLEIELNQVNKTSDLLDFQVKNLNMWVDNTLNFVSEKEWNDCSGEIPFNINESKVYIGIDFATKEDLLAVSYLYTHPDYEKVYLDTQFYMHNQNITGIQQYYNWNKLGYLTAAGSNYIDYVKVSRDIINFPYRNNIVGIYCDPHNASHTQKEFENNGFDVFEFGQSAMIFNEPTEQFERYIKEQNLIHSNNLVMNWCVSNVKKFVASNGNVKPVKKSDSQKIDGVISSIQAFGGYFSDLIGKEEKPLKKKEMDVEVVNKSLNSFLDKLKTR